MSRHGMQVCFFPACSLICASVMLHGQTASLSATSMSFGNQAIGTTSATKSVKLTNTSATVLLISSITPSLPAPPFTVTSNCPGSLIQNASCTITATFGPTATGSASETISIADNATNSPQKINLSGTGVVQASVSPTSLSFGSVAVGFSKSMTVTLTNNLPAALAISGETASGDYAVNNTGVTGPCGSSLAAGGHCSIGVTFRPSVLGTRTGSLTITDGATSCPQVVSLSGSGVTQTTVSPASVSFGNVGLGVNSTTSVTLTNNLTTAISVGIPSATGDFAVNTTVSGYCGSTLAGGAHCSIGVTLTPTQLGTRTGTLTITDSAGNSPFTVPLTGTGTTSSLSSITVTPSSPTMILNSTQQFTATANFPGGITMNVTASATWSSSSTTIASVTSQGVVSSIKAGTSTIKATYASKSGSTVLTVTIPVKPLITWPTPAPITYGTSLGGAQLNAVATVNGVQIAGTYLYYPPAGDTPNFTPDGTNLSVQFTPTDTVRYLPASASVVLVVNRATVNILFSKMTLPYSGGPQSPTVTTSQGDMPYVITFNGAGPWPVNVGNYAVQATVYWTNYQGVGTGTFTITNATPVFSNLSSQTIVAGTPSIHASGTIAAGTAIPAGESVAISLNGGTPTPVIIGANGGFSATLTTSSLSASNTPYTITYHYGGDNSPFNAAIDATTSLTVNPPTLASITLSPKNAAIALNGTQQLKATGMYTDNTTQDLTGTARWSFAANSPASAAAITSVAGGMATAATSGCGGPVTITATSGSVSASTTLMVGVPGGFACGTNTTAARDGQTATLLNNGLILIAGGLGSGGTPVGSAELYDPAAHTVTPTVSLNIPRAYHTATLLDSGKVLIAGGVDGSGNPLGSAEVYDPVLGFTPVPDQGALATARFNHTATLLIDGRVAVTGGTGTGGDVATVEVYDPSLNGFSSPGSLGTARNSHSATLLSTGDILIAGGYAGGTATTSAEIVTILWNTDGTTTFSTTAAAPMNNARALHTATAAGNGLVLLAGGVDATGAAGNTAETYDPSTKQFTALSATMACSRASHSATELTNGTILFAGGCSDPTNSAEIFDPAGPSFTAATLPLNTPRTFQSANLVHCACPEDGWVLLADGVDSLGNVLNSTEWYQPSSTTPAGLNSIQVSSSGASIALGSTAQFTAVGSFTSGPQPLNSVSWTSSDPTVLTISNDATNSGWALPAGPGQVTVTACAGSICGSTDMTVTP